MSGYLKAATAKGMRIRYGSAVQTIRPMGVDELKVVSNGESIKTKVLVNASGAWANMIAKWPEQPNYRFTLAGVICLSRRRWIGLNRVGRLSGE